MRDANAPCGRLGCVPHLQEGKSLSIVIDRLAFDEDCARAEVVVTALTAPAGCKEPGEGRRDHTSLLPSAQAGCKDRPARGRQASGKRNFGGAFLARTTHDFMKGVQHAKLAPAFACLRP